MCVCVCFRENPASPVLLGIVATQGLQVSLVSRVYPGLLGRKVERCGHVVLTHTHTVIVSSDAAVSVQHFVQIS